MTGLTWGRGPAVLAVVLVLLAGACGDDDDEPQDAAVSDSLAVGTYNAGLARGLLDHAVARGPEVADALADVDLDLVCVQEFWEQEDWEALTAASSLPHVQRQPAEAGEAGRTDTCEGDELDPLEACVRDNCDVPPGELVSCSLAMCPSDVEAVSQACLGCITGAVGDTTLDEVVALCEPGGPGATTPYAYGGSYGTGLLSRHPLSDEDFLMLDGTINRRGVLYAQIEGYDAEPIHVFCTHLTARQAGIPYPGEADSWADENGDQIEALLAYVDDKVEDGERALLLGDLNAGPDLDGIAAELPDNYALLTDAGFDNPYAEQSDVACSYCANNALQGVDSSGSSVLIDHVLLSGWSEPQTDGDQFLRGTLALEIDGDTVETAYSDHYGVRLRISYE